MGSVFVRPISVIRGSPTGVRTSSARRRKLESNSFQSAIRMVGYNGTALVARDKS